MAIVRESVYQVLFALLQSAYPWKLSSRRLQHWSQVEASQQPAMFLVQAGETMNDHVRGIPVKSSLHARVYLYTNVGNDEQATPATQLNNALDAIVKIMTPVTGQFITLGNQVYKARISGEVKTDEGFLGPQAVAIVPIEIVTPN